MRCVFIVYSGKTTVVSLKSTTIFLTFFFGRFFLVVCLFFFPFILYFCDSRTVKVNLFFKKYLF